MNDAELQEGTTVGVSVDDSSIRPVQEMARVKMAARGKLLKAYLESDQPNKAIQGKREK